MAGTNLYSLVTAKALGFSDYDTDDWDIILLAHAPMVIVVAADSPYTTIDGLLKENQDNKLNFANSGGGTLGYVAAYLFAETTEADFVHTDYPGHIAAINAVINKQSDFTAVTTHEAAVWLRSGALRILEENTSLFGAIDNFGESYGIIFPKGIPAEKRASIQDYFKAAVFSEGFSEFAAHNYLVPFAVTESDISDNNYAKELEQIIRRILHSTGFVRGA
jgi:tripartite-type tricarboxylate transporter receptor subunit TctC